MTRVIPSEVEEPYREADGVSSRDPLISLRFAQNNSL